uniref:Uncharacterized protein n=1 Tax=Laticauda laticaudata TaxID=8630 RepID=A0A8C5WTK0_LATLA
MHFPLPVQSAEAENGTVWWRLREVGRARAQLFSELVAVGERRVSLAMEPYPTEVVLRPTSPYQYPQAISSPAVRDYVVWSMFSFTTCNCCCLGLFALLYSIKSRDRKVLGDPEGAANHGRTAKYLNIAAVMITIVLGYTFGYIKIILFTTCVSYFPTTTY